MRVPVRPPARPLLAVLLIAAVVVACSVGTGSPSASTSPASTALVIDSPQAAAKLLASKSPLFEAIEPKNPDLIGQADWWEAVPLDGAAGKGWRVTFRVGWGDCPSGCIDEHTWTYDVTADGTLSVVGETGPVLPADVLVRLRSAAAATGVAGRVIAGPTCPVESPTLPVCNPRPVASAVLLVKGAGGVEVARITTDATGLFRIGLQPGDYTLEPQPVQGLMGTAQPMPFTVTDGSETFLDVSYDTGIR